MASHPDTQDAFAKMDLNRERSQLSESDFKQMVELQQGLVKSDEKTIEHLRGVRTNEQLVTDAIHGIGLGITPSRRKEDDQKINVLRRSVDEQVTTEQTRTGKPVSAQEVQRITDALLTQHVVSSPGMLWGTNESKKRIFEMGPNDKLVLSVDDIPSMERRALTQRLRQSGLPVTQDALIAQYRAYLSGLVRRGPE